MSTPAATPQASRAMRSFATGGSFGVIAMNGGTLAIGSMITNIEVTASKLYSL
jgi:hypothetical protein